MSNIKRFIRSVPILGSLSSSLYAVLKTKQSMQSLRSELADTRAVIETVSRQQQVAQDTASEKTSSLGKRIDSMSQQLDLISKMERLPAPKQTGHTSDSKLFASNHLADSFYAVFEDKFRGSEDEIIARLRKDYLPLFKTSGLVKSQLPVLDIGSGRGEFLRLMKELGINVTGMDINLDMVERANKKKLKTIQGDAVEHLSSLKPQTLGAITGFHIVEHIPFDTLLQLFSACHRSLKEGGFVLFETPNPENIGVSSHTFYLDPSHLHPLPPQLLAFTLEETGFRKVEILRLHPVKGKSDPAKALPKDVATMFFGPQDYAVIAYK